MTSFYDNLTTHTYRLEFDEQGATLRLYVAGERKNAAIRVEVTERTPADAYLRLNMPEDDRAELRLVLGEKGLIKSK